MPSGLGIGWGETWSKNPPPSSQVRIKSVYGYACLGASQRVNAAFGAVFLRAFPDWCGTGEEYQMYRLALK